MRHALITLDSLKFLFLAPSSKFSYHLSLSLSHTHTHTYTSMLLRGDYRSTLTKRGPVFLVIFKKQKLHTKFSFEVFFHNITEKMHFYFFLKTCQVGT